MQSLQIINVSKQYAHHKALDSISLAVPKGSVYGLLGPNGAGKTSLIRIITQITGADEGEVLFNGEKLNPSHIYRMGYLPEERGLYKKMEVGEQLLFFARLKGLSRADAMHKLKDWVERFEIKNWWTKKDEEEFSARAKYIIRQFNEFTPVDTLHVNGEASQGENIADLGGVLLGLDAFKKTEAFKSGKLIGGLTPLQRYFLGYAYGWMGQERKESLAAKLKTDVHAPAKERVNGPFVNVPEFYEAFHISPTDKMYRPDSLRVRIW